MDGIDVSQWAMSAAQALITAMTTDLWAGARDRFAGLLARRPESAGEVAEELDDARQQLLDAGVTEEAAEETSAEWVSRFRRALTRDPSLVEEIRTLLEEQNVEAPAASGRFTQNFSATGGGIVFNQGTGTQANQVHSK
ncbi:hypothetical protein [Kitasatospora sp. NPDC056181]|uniref:hypothetical protein n=1 Tax=Kitasatospora sp. NPDC056181 TaxID=3345737 RepID=UPI0035D9EA24